MRPDAPPGRGYYGIYRGVVTQNSDPENLYRVKAIVPQLFGTEVETDWAWPCIPPQWVPTAGHAVQSPLPSVGGPVWIAFESGDQNKPIWMGVWVTL